LRKGKKREEVCIFSGGLREESELLKEKEKKGWIILSYDLLMRGEKGGEEILPSFAGGRRRRFRRQEKRKGKKEKKTFSLFFSEKKKKRGSSQRKKKKGPRGKKVGDVSSRKWQKEK